MNLKLVQKIINSKNKYDIDIDINKICTDSREIEKGDIFLALNSGFLYVDDAIKNGAVAIITEQVNSNYDIPILKVEDTKKTLKTIGSYYRDRYKGKVIAITGSNGKTTTKELFKHVLSSKYHVLANKDSENNILGVSKTLLKLNNDYDFLVLELGMNHDGEISELSHLVKPDIGIITNIGSSHIGYLGSRENIFKAKMEILDGNPNMDLYVNGNDEYLKNVSAKKFYPNIYSKFVEMANSSAIIEVAKILGFNENDIELLLGTFKSVDSRMQKHYINEHILIDDAYNASYESFVCGLEEIKKYEKRKVIIFGDMLELGTYSSYYHQKVYEKIKELDNVIIVTIGEESSVLNNQYHFYDLEKLQKFLRSFKWRNDDIVYLKASHKIGLSTLVPFFKEIW